MSRNDASGPTGKPPSAPIHRAYLAAQAAFPSIALPEAAFAEGVATRIADDPDARGLAFLRTNDLYLALACARGDRAALSVLDEEIFSRLRTGLARAGLRDVADEAVQQARITLCIGGTELSPQINGYRARGPLSLWVRTATMRIALKLRTRGDPAIPCDDAIFAAIPDPSEEPAIKILRERHRADFLAAFQKALKVLSPEERNVLRLHLLDGVPLEQIGRLYGTHKSTISRWISRARETLAAETRTALAQALNLSPSDLDSLARLLPTLLDASWRTILAVS